MSGSGLSAPPDAREGSSQVAAATAEPPATDRKTGAAHVLACHDLVKTYGMRRVVDEVTVRLESGEVVGLLGPNGAGKTTTFRMIVGLIQPDRGTVALDERNLTGLAMHRRARSGIGYLPQEPSIFRGLTVEENVLAILEAVPRMGRRARRERAGALLEEFGLTERRRNLGHSLSGGERRRAEIARALAPDPRFLLLDEPFAAIDPIAVSELQRIVGGLRDRGLGVLVTDHSVRETLRVTDRAYIIEEGRILFEGTPAELVRSPEVRRAYLGEDFDWR
ncbi:MAG: LPS export ABC transporter ATP-binding protein [Acidobacteria bacterium]|nr:LPS export ABC transporter ATP-binding protein [Acidobacteriota bacterium]MYF13100.1 LPS export ABC transporter ATP-binding protein [Acidobacteriota bacterium]MYI95838.1 LPS export ABC transporter ATP-binding protein [Acidobacteriota bacterium]